jgi:5-hydroxyisourate hydrolase-like protein (transthyretin family)
MTHHLTRVLSLGVLVATLAVPAPATAQILGGHVVEATSGRSIARLRVRLVRASGDSASRATVDSALTDAGGLFQLSAPAPGAYQVVFGPALGVARGPVDTLAAATDFVERRYSVPSPLPRRSSRTWRAR